MTGKSERRDKKRRQREKSKRMRGNRSVFTILREKLKRNRYYETGTIKARGTIYTGVDFDNDTTAVARVVTYEEVEKMLKILDEIEASDEH